MKEYGKWDGENGFNWDAWGGGRTRQMYKSKVIKSYIWKISKQVGLIVQHYTKKKYVWKLTWYADFEVKVYYTDIEF